MTMKDLRGVDWTKIYPGRFLHAEELGGRDVTVTIAGVFMDALASEDDGTEEKVILTFDKTEKQLALNITNKKCLAAMFPGAVDACIGKRITIGPEEWRKGDLAIRIKGSPDISGPVKVKVVENRKQRIKTMVRTVSSSTAKAPAPAREPGCDDGEEAAK